MPPLIHPCPTASCPGKGALAQPSSRGVNGRVERAAGKRGAWPRQGAATILTSHCVCHFLLARKASHVPIFCFNDLRGTHAPSSPHIASLSLGRFPAQA